VDECKPLEPGDELEKAVKVGRCRFPINPTFKASRTTRLKLQFDEPPSSVAFKLNLRRYIKGLAKAWKAGPGRCRMLHHTSSSAAQTLAS